MIQMQSILEVADNSGAKKVLTITVLGQGKKIAHVGDIISCAARRRRFAVLTVPTCGSTTTPRCSSTRTRPPSGPVFSDRWRVSCARKTS